MLAAPDGQEKMKPITREEMYLQLILDELKKLVILQEKNEKKRETPNDRGRRETNPAPNDRHGRR